MSETYRSGDFTLPGEAGYDELTLSLARRWGADAIRDSDGTKLSGGIKDAGYLIYSTLCVIREHNDFAARHPDAQQQAFLCSKPVLATSETVSVPLLDGYCREQFELNAQPEAIVYWQAYDRTENRLLPARSWRYQNGEAVISGCKPFHEYTVSFLCYRVWEEISMYNHTTNNWSSEHLRQIDPRHPLAWEYLTKYIEAWCERNPATSVVRFTSLFYNFVWIFGDDMRNRSLYVDWAGYDFTVSPRALRAFECEYGYALTAEDFVAQGKRRPTHRPPTQAKRDYMDFIQRFVADKAKALVDVVHRYGKKAYVFYDDSWVGMEPYGEYFSSIGFDGLIKCLFSGFECRLCAGADVPVHELRLHPYLFPVGLGGQPTFAPGGDPARDALRYWRNVRRALLRSPVERIGLGGYLHLTKEYPDFVDAIESIANDFRRIKALHASGAPHTLPCRAAVLSVWGSLRSWTLNGHFHENDGHVLIHVIEALSGLPVDVSFISFEDVKNGALEGVDVLINAGRAGDAWSGGGAWNDAELVEAITRFVYEGGAFLGVGEPSAVPGFGAYFRMARVMGVDKDTGERACHGRFGAHEEESPPFAVMPRALGDDPFLFLTDASARVLCEKQNAPQMTINGFGKGMGAYMSGFVYSPESARMLLDLLLYLCGLALKQPYLSSDPRAEAAYFPEGSALVVVNNTDAQVETTITTPERDLAICLAPGETRFMEP